METKTKSTSKNRKVGSNAKKDVKDKLTVEAKNVPVNGSRVKTESQKQKLETSVTPVSLDDRI